MARRRRKSVSISSLGAFLRCPAQYFFHYYSGAPKLTDYPRLCGIKVHGFIKKLELGTGKAPRVNWSDPKRRFFYSDLEKAIKAWRTEWRLSVANFSARGKLINPNDADTFRFSAIGATCITNYWNSLQGLTLPTAVEKTYRYPWLETGIELNGNLDQIRPANLAYARAKRPQLFKGGQLHPDFAPVIILDFKTGWDSIAPVPGKEKSPEEMMREQFFLHFDIQATAYSWLYFKHTGKWPIGFWFNFLRTNSVYFTHRDGFPQEEDLGKSEIAALNAAILHLIDSENAQSYPRHISKSNCKSCDYIELCLGRKEFTIAAAEQISGPPLDPSTLEVAYGKVKVKRPRMKLKVERVKREPVLELPTGKPEITIHRDLPWREQDLDWEEAT